MSQIDWNSLQNEAFLNPAWGADVREVFSLAVSELAQKRNLISCVFLASSGTSQLGEIKVYAITKESFLTAAASVNAVQGANSNDIWLRALPNFHVGGLAMGARAFLAKGSLVEFQEKWSPQEFVKSCLTSRATITSLVPTQVYDLVQAELRCPSSLREVLIGGGAIDDGLLESFRQLGWPSRISYGMTELGSTIAVSGLKDKTLKMLPHVSALVDSEGLICLKSKTLFCAMTRVSLVKQSCDGGFEIFEPKSSECFTTTDRGFVREMPDGQVIDLLGRQGEQVKILGELVDLDYLQQILNQTTGADPRLCLLGILDHRRGVNLILAGELHSHEDLENIKNKFNDKVLGFERIQMVLNVGLFPRTALGKIEKKKLQKNITDHINQNKGIDQK